MYPHLHPLCGKKRSGLGTKEVIGMLRKRAGDIADARSLLLSNMLRITGILRDNKTEQTSAATGEEMRGCARGSRRSPSCVGPSTPERRGEDARGRQQEIAIARRPIDEQR
ncbi:hypothetical protein E2562_030847 [Oryza meyeriana var. granulata]|uniref:Uncharacterized protein n=1 Tax=Oryza meyeriana var. granulata TaxID=110450 RepID=A0A6G1EZX1_9ORYZ|nr:hypothetical protein E2562_030847 [Oryza meyeriana var. granulata]